MLDSEYLEKVTFGKNTANISHMIKSYLSFKRNGYFFWKVLIDWILNTDWKAWTMPNNKSSSSFLQFKNMMHVITQK